MMNGIVPGPFLFRDHAEFVWGVIASFCIGNAILLVLSLPLIALWVKIIEIPRGSCSRSCSAFASSAPTASTARRSTSA